MEKAEIRNMVRSLKDQDDLCKIWKQFEEIGEVFDLLRGSDDILKKYIDNLNDVLQSFMTDAGKVAETISAAMESFDLGVKALESRIKTLESMIEKLEVMNGT